jgi:16S rRNA (cytidine1402-2'-O)-methyltransferase
MAIKKIYLIPNELAEGTAELYLSPIVYNVVRKLHVVFCEDFRTTRRLISKLVKGVREVESYQLFELTKDTTLSMLTTQIATIKEDCEVGIISDAGCPGIADPGALMVAWAHQNNIDVVPLPGPSSILLALMASGLNGQSFAFNGYLPIDKAARKKGIAALEKLCLQTKQTQLFMETPYRNQNMVNDLLSVLQPNTLLTIAYHITASNEFIKTKPVKEWQKQPPLLEKHPAIFAINALAF